jgi:hypothetical protein
MADLGRRGNVMGPQPISERTAVPAAMRAAADHFLKLLTEGKRVELNAMVTPDGGRELDEIAASLPTGVYSRHEIIATAHINQHHYVKAKLIGAGVAPLTLQFRLGESDGRWIVWEAMSLSDGRTAWTR